jgi:two-component system NtrC family sensor kinase
MPEAKILIIDDSTELRSLLESILPYSGYQTISATTGQEGLDFAEKLRPDLILLDLELPDTTGLEVLESLGRQAHSIPTIMMTGYGSEGVAADALRLGAQGYLVKPFTTEEVLSGIERALTVGRLHRERAHRSALLETYSRHLQVIQAIGRAMITDHDLDRFFHRIVEAGVYATRAEACFLSLVDATPEQQRIVAAHGNQEYIGHRFPLQAGDERLWAVIQEGIRLRIHASSKSPIVIQTGKAVEALLQVPLKDPQGIKGVLSVDRQSTGIPFSKQDEQVLAILADYVIIALDRYKGIHAAELEPLRSPDNPDRAPD